MIRELLEIFLFRLFYHIFEIIPLSIGLTFARIIGSLNLWIQKIRVKVVIKQLHEAFPEKSDKDIKRIAKETFINFSKYAIEFCWFSTKSIEEKNKYVSICGLENIDIALSYGKGLILLTGHFGNWELGGQIIAQYTNKLYAVARKQRNSYFNNFINNIRTSNKAHIIPQKYAFRGIVKAVKNNNIILILGDQNAGKHGIFVDFFGKPASTYPGTAKIALKFGCPIIFSACLRQPNGKNRLYIEKPIFLKQKESPDIDVKNYTQELTSLLEKWIRQYPSQWFWLHRRWKTKMPGQK
ncbi:MAG: lysophospholipid acyltransferase family protein [Candidatus Cloacimonetes bacterium]|nr:lysophospholipid acyltransferase family protein [Candidatus Cloacimonadota bacterium]MBL7086059.1 lysophospholipid acyltransferase family protein [Candidatus Cloacimonadota bacterium]